MVDGWSDDVTLEGVYPGMAVRTETCAERFETIMCRERGRSRMIACRRFVLSWEASSSLKKHVRKFRKITPINGNVTHVATNDANCFPRPVCNGFFPFHTSAPLPPGVAASTRVAASLSFNPSVSKYVPSCTIAEGTTTTGVGFGEGGGVKTTRL